MSERIITVNKENALEKIKENRAKHAEQYAEALTGYKNQMKAFLKKQLRLLADTEESRSFRIGETPVEPTHNLEDYDRFIGMLEWEEDTVVDLTETEFTQVIQDNWFWKANWARTYMSYSGKALY